jgi:hypothetical protein
MFPEGPPKTHDELGGEDEPEEDDHESRSCDKPGHRERSIAHQPNHEVFWHNTITLPENTVIVLVEK